MVNRQQKGLHSFCYAYILSVEPILEELEDPGIIDLRDSVQKPVSDGQKPKLTLETEEVIFTLGLQPFLKAIKKQIFSLFNLKGFKCLWAQHTNPYTLPGISQDGSNGLKVPPTQRYMRSTVIHTHNTCVVCTWPHASVHLCFPIN